ncbi:hypothetical protein M3P36_14210 [Altererythrobacter sp. KTW20L]|uniref:hypothetical protein n=1 Tax=Altererythrobacter sp. KTW20L TaxID=2942210 RepID=UPI0020BFF5D0|nr:hypothetical protein [Altererythrobacter sp. KTW20L]MCL6252194.1 hypothetical protein [Altererythrobacter sp. KTW20L]
MISKASALDTCFGALEVNLIQGEPMFASHRRLSIGNAERYLIHRSTRALAASRHVVLGSPHAVEGFQDRAHILRDGLTFLDIIAADNEAQPLELTLQAVTEPRMRGLAAAFGLPDPPATGLIDKARFADVRAQLVWLAYVATNLKESEAQNLFAAFQAWKIIEKARPLRF